MEKQKETKERVERTPVRVGISIGDINGIGPEVIMKALEDARMLLDCTPIIYGSPKVFSFYKKEIDAQEFNYQTVPSAAEANNRKINVINVISSEPEFTLGQATQIGGKYAMEALEQATQDLASGKIDVLVTAPISKEAMAKAGFKFPGHTEYLADLSGEEDALMLMVSNALRVGLVTSHIPLKEVSETITVDKVLAKIRAFSSSLNKDFALSRPKIAVFGVNPHAGENGKMGSEEQDVIIPAIARAKSEGILAFGPFPADGFFGSGAIAQYDGVLAMYHDQGLAAFKALAFDDGVNFTAGLPIIRTSPDHGTAFDIVGKDKASGQSMRSAIYLAIDIHRNHQMHKEISADPLAFSPKEERRGDRRREI
ncbi:MAG: 4-hydroxythreonine-4-phosphate dehydrogenase PdxA [Bacteroidetes bacterium RIFCSPHIGHO2_02_FULL_44_7]|nr:MAG: 4-hydroxythreonine-4-phosphate dehydrogenase PdxA [Bacteroidetes bacterium RIFCSPHIGHO2_02_FULL_44_7]